MRSFHACFALLLAAPLAMILSGPAHAQLGLPHAAKPHQQAQPKEAPPPALPGTMNQFQPAPPTQQDLSPNDALFDAINRGDLAAARDAVNHGADLNTHNVLGMTPLDLSIDLSRNNITFLLLSLRGASGGESGPPSIADSGKKSPKATAAAKATHARPSIAAAAPHTVHTRKLLVEQQFAGSNDPGTPDPQAGFLGFGGADR